MLKKPNNAKKVFEGVLFDVWQWEQELFNGKKAIFEKVVRLNSSQIILVTQNNKLILFNESQPANGNFISFCGGVVERDETPEQNAKKELLEETGMICDNLKLWKKGGIYGKVEWETFYFIAKGCRKVQEQRLEDGERIEILELDFEEFVEKCLDENFRNKEFSNMIFKMKHTPGELDKFKREIFER